MVKLTAPLSYEYYSISYAFVKSFDIISKKLPTKPQKPKKEVIYTEA
ncbi:MAG: hypothetical protein LBF68_06330 [Christensenellaceae bacterium]|jgi:hypothetical protein|nr:hypothetical protein [Christensenellaceae bacterium]